MNHLVDSCGWLEFFMVGPNASLFEPAIRDRERLIVPTVCLSEVFKILYRREGRTTALGYVMSMQKGTVVDLDRSIALEAGMISVDHKLPLADSIILATAMAYDARVWTQDAHLKIFREVKFVGKN